ncbi:hypothetical protein E1B28_006670 [Marasmius oreades]|uniref:chitin deacetylase n=1 Tax=Marasmius oreades TaxID=181124 RepID=A0A9P7UWL2_9AGAR|nr:uncharacterized protein E1B28_006670 [Marasmius oreades]KAG7095987.1 hypothetical protein E1B28_006670 [Marasmius oreades]
MTSSHPLYCRISYDDFVHIFNIHSSGSVSTSRRDIKTDSPPPDQSLRSCLIERLDLGYQENQGNLFHSWASLSQGCPNSGTSSPSGPMFASFLTLLLLSPPLEVIGSLKRYNVKQNLLITEPEEQCKYYYYPPANKARYNFPPIWKVAKLLANDTDGQAKWKAIEDSIPADVAVKTMDSGDFSSTLKTYSTSDPDCWWTSHQCTTPKHPGIPADIATVPEPLTTGYGFDDGPNCSNNAFYDYLRKNNQKATMFFIGSNVLGWPLEAQRALFDGHEICVHTWSHRQMTSLSNEEAFAELWYSKSLAMQAIKTIVGVTPTCWRPPFGDTDDRIRAIAHGLGLTNILWKWDTFDWEVGPSSTTSPTTVDENYQEFIHAAKNGTFDREGGILLLHESSNFTMSEAIKFYPAMKDAFKHIVPVGVALNWTQPYVEKEFYQPSFSEYISGNTTKPLPAATLKRFGAGDRVRLELPVALMASLLMFLPLLL